MVGLVGEVPVELAVVVPLAVLTELAAHEEQLLAGVSPHPAEQQAHVGELLPAVPRHLADERAFPVDHLVVGDRQRETLGERVPDGEREAAVVVAPVDRVVRHVVERIVHPAHVPLHGEAQASHEHRPRYLRIRGRFLGDGARIGILPAHRDVHLLQELDRVEVLLAAVHVGNPLAVLAPVVEVEHRGHGVHAQAVDVELVQPEERRGREERAHLVAAVIEDGTLPLGVEAQARVGVLVKVRAVELGQAMRILGEVRRHPVEDHADAVLVQHVHQVHEVLRRAVARRGREVAGGLVPPRAVERMLGDRHQLHVGEAQPVQVLRQRLRDAAIGGQLALGLAAPRAQVQLVDALRGVERVLRAAIAHPVRVAPFVVERPGARRGGRRHLVVECVGVGAILDVAVPGGDRVLVRLAALHQRHVGFPDSGLVPARPQHVDAASPVVPVADDRDLARVGGPHREMRSTRLAQLAPHSPVERRVGPFPEEIDVLLAEPRHRARTHERQWRWFWYCPSMPGVMRVTPFSETWKRLRSSSMS